MTTVSVIIPTHNRKEYLQECIGSVLAQTYTDYEVIVVDDGSTDGTRAAVAQYEDPRLRYVYQENAGGSAARNRGLLESTAPYVLFLDSDDLLLPTALESLLHEAERYPAAGVIGGGYQHIDERGVVFAEVQPWILDECLDLKSSLLSCPLRIGATLVQREWLERVGGFDTGQEAGQDWDLWVRLALMGCPMIWLKRTVLQYRQHSGAITADPRRRLRASLRLLDKFYGREDIPEDILGLRQEIYTRVYLNVAAQEYASEQYELAKEDLAYAIQLDPRLLAEDGRRLFFTFAWWTRSHLGAGTAEPYIANIVDHLPDAAARFSGLRRKALAELSAVRLFEAYRERDWPAVRRFAIDMVRYLPLRALDKGVVSILLESIIGDRATRSLRQVLRPLRRPREASEYY